MYRCTDEEVEEILTENDGEKDEKELEDEEEGEEGEEVEELTVDVPSHEEQPRV